MHTLLVVVYELDDVDKKNINILLQLREILDDVIDTANKIDIFDIIADDDDDDDDIKNVIIDIQALVDYQNDVLEVDSIDEIDDVRELVVIVVLDVVDNLIGERDFSFDDDDEVDDFILETDELDDTF